MPGDLHERLAEQGAQWLKRQGFGVVAVNLVAAGCRERADVVGFRAQCSVVIEAKSRRSDFLADAGKPHRTAGGLGLYRFYICPTGLILPGELPPRWGLLYAGERKVAQVVRPPGNAWPGRATALPAWAAFQHQNDPDAERSVLYSIARRLAADHPRTT